VEELADRQAALRRVATLVAEEGPASEVFDAVAVELAGLLHAHHVVVCRYEPDSELEVLAHRGTASRKVPAGTRINHEGGSVEAVVRRTGRSVRMESYEGVEGTIAELARAEGVEVTVGAPVVVEGRLWGVASAGWNRGQPPPADAEERIARFAELVATAIVNVQARTDLAASRARTIAAADEARRRLVRDLHDGAQQRLVHTIVMLKLAHRALERGGQQADELLSEAQQHAQSATEELRELAQGILPSALTAGGLAAGVKALASRMSIPVEVDVPVDRLPGVAEPTAYFIIAEALTNVVKHSQAAHAWVTVRSGDRMVEVQVRDDGLGGARSDGPGLVGLRDRLAAVGGWLRVASPQGGGTLIAASIPTG
jgi:signal transduction histidine kinase